jgi:hypothetical protein
MHPEPRSVPCSHLRPRGHWTRESSSSSGSAGSPPSEASRGIEHGEESSDVPEHADRHIFNKMGR